MTCCRPPRGGLLSPYEAVVANGWKRTMSADRETVAMRCSTRHSAAQGHVIIHEFIPPSAGGIGWLRPLLFKRREMAMLPQAGEPTPQILAPVFLVPDSACRRNLVICCILSPRPAPGLCAQNRLAGGASNLLDSIARAGPGAVCTEQAGWLAGWRGWRGW